MSDGEILARHYATSDPILVRWRAGRFTEIAPAKTSLPDDRWIAPPLFDLQINGYAGVDFQQDSLSVADLERATRKLRSDGCARFLLTLITDEWNALVERLRHLRSLRNQSEDLKSAVVGWHVEGPFLSAEPGFHGAHNPSVMIDPKPEHIHELRRIAENDPLLITVAPERPGALDAIKLAVAHGIKVSLGHTNASAEVLRQAVAAGATGFTHLGNGCPRELDRHDNILWRVFETPGLLVSLIPDQIHVSPPFFRLAHRTLGSDAVYYTTDAMAAAASPPGRYRIGKLEVEVGADQIVRQPGKPLFAGSALRPVDGVFRAAQMLGCPWQETWKRFSETPARLMGLRNELGKGQPADFCVIQVGDDNRFTDLQTYVTGRA